MDIHQKNAKVADSINKEIQKLICPYMLLDAWCLIPYEIWSCAIHDPDTWMRDDSEKLW